MIVDESLMTNDPVRSLVDRGKRVYLDIHNALNALVSLPAHGHR
jgi:hypothetical protein